LYFLFVSLFSLLLLSKPNPPFSRLNTLSFLLSLLTFFFYLRSPCFSHSPYLYAMTKLLKPFSWWNDCGH
jgi:hypothetical protein